MSQPKKTIAEQIVASLNEIASFNFDANANFQNESARTILGYRPLVEGASATAKYLENLDWASLPESLQIEAQQCTNQIHDHILQLKDFSFPPNLSPQDHVNRTIGSLFQHREETQRKIPIAFHTLRLISFTPLLLLSDKSRNDLLAETDNLKSKTSEVDRALKEVASLLDKMRETAGKIGAEKHSKEFKELADTHWIFGLIWLVVTVLLFIGTVVAAYYLFSVEAMFQTKPAESAAELKFSELAPRVLILSIIYSATVWCSKIYKSHRHLHVLNKHRETALQTFRTFVGAAENDQQVKNAILLECTRTIFSSSASGYLGSDSVPLSSTVVDVVRAVTKSDSSKIN